MFEHSTKNKICVIIGASHAGVNCAFSLRQQAWEGAILLFDADPMLPYHRPPLSKAYLTNEEGIKQHLLKPAESYEKANIELHLGVSVQVINRNKKTIVIENGKVQKYDKLVLATGARPIIPSFVETWQYQVSTPNELQNHNVFPIRTSKHATQIRTNILKNKNKRVVIIGGGYIGLETAASLKKSGAVVTILEREERILARVTAPEMSDFFHQLHTEKRVHIFTNKNVIAIKNSDGVSEVVCSDGSNYIADIIIIGVGIRVNTELAAAAGLTIKNGIKVDETACTNDENIYAIGDCTFHYNPHYERFIRLESVQNAVDQAKVAAAAICGKNPIYDTIPWFWSDQYDIKLQMIGLFHGYDQVLVRKETEKKNCFSIWYFKGDELLAVDAVNHGKAYVLGTRFIKNRQKIDKDKLVDETVAFKPNNFILGS